jgi:hypothetical protein
VKFEIEGFYISSAALFKIPLSVSTEYSYRVLDEGQSTGADPLENQTLPSGSDILWCQLVADSVQDSLLRVPLTLGPRSRSCKNV